MITISDVEKLSTLETISTSDLFQVLKKNDYSMFLSYREKAQRFLDVYQEPTFLKALKTSLAESVSKLREISASMLTRSSANARYEYKDSFESKKEQLLSQENMESIISKYVTNDILNAKAAELRTESIEMADSMTDFAGNAMVNINNSTQALKEPEETPPEEP